MIHFHQLTYSYPEAQTTALRNLDLHIDEGEFVLLVGASGAGKSTLLRCINGLTPHFSGGVLSGHLRVNGLDPVQAGPPQMSRHVGFVFQDPEAQFVMDQVEDEIAFALENAAMPPQEMRVRVEETLDLLDLSPLRSRRLNTLSGGEKQRVAIAAALAFRPAILVLDEPTSQLDPKSAEDVLTALMRLNSDLGLTIVLAEHRLERVLPFVDRMIYLQGAGDRAARFQEAELEGSVLTGTPAEVLAQIELTPPLVKLAKALDWQPLPLTIKDGLRFSRAWLHSYPVAPPRKEQSAQETRLALLEAQGVTVHYGDSCALSDVDLALYPGEIVALLGRNGSGKTTLLKTLVGLMRPGRGCVMLAGRDCAKMEVAEICRQVGYLPQDPNSLLFADTVEEELLFTLRNHGIAPTTAPIAPIQLLKQVGLADKAEAYPRDLSVGERQRVALAAITVTQPRVLLLDEPTRGLDYAAKAALIELLRAWRAGGTAIALVTHDVELAASLADRVIHMSQGEIIAQGAPADVLGASPLFAPQIARLFPGTGWLTVEDVRDFVSTS